MTVGLLVISHDRVGSAMVDTAVSLLGVRPLPIEILHIRQESNPDKCIAQARELSNKLNQGDGVLVLTDLYGSTPCNIASTLHDNDNIIVIAGMNLSMLIRILNYHNLSLAELVHKAITGGHDGILICKTGYTQND